MTLYGLFLFAHNAIHLTSDKRVLKAFTSALLVQSTVLHNSNEFLIRKPYYISNIWSSVQPISNKKQTIEKEQYIS